MISTHSFLRHGFLALVWTLGLSSCAINPVPTPFGGSDKASEGTGTATADASSSMDIGAVGGDAKTDTSTGGTDSGGWGDDASDVSAPDATGGFTGLTQAGAQDFGQFRQILEAGGVPTPGSLDDLGFFAEHKLDYPAPTCGQDMCLHALLGIMGNMITGSTCTVVQMGLNTPMTVDKLVRPPLHLVVAVDISGSMQGAPLQGVQQGLQQMLDHLKPGDHLSIVTFADTVQTVVEFQDPQGNANVEKAILQLEAGQQTDLYAGLFTAYQVAAKHALPTQQNRVLLVTDGTATKGLQVPGKLVSLAQGWATQGIGITTVGVGKGVDAAVLSQIAEIGAGSSYFLDKAAAIKEVFTEEVATFVVPVALDVHIAVSPGSGYVIRGVYGTHGWHGDANGGSIDIPSLYLAGRTEAQQPLPGTGEGRRGGGGAILVELIALPGVQDKTVGALTMAWKHPQTGKVVTQEVTVDGPYLPGVQIPDGGVFTNPTVEKGFVMLNLFVGLQMACALAGDGDPGAARGVLEALDLVARQWEKGHPDPDIDDDLKYVEMFVANLKKLANQTPVGKPPEPWPKKD